MTNIVKHARVSKAHQMRAVAVKLQEEGRKPRPVDLQRALAARGIVVSSGHACVVLNKFLGKKRRRRVAAKVASHAERPVSRGPVSRSTMTLSQIDETAQVMLKQAASAVKQAKTAMEQLSHVVERLEALLVG